MTIGSPAAFFQYAEKYDYVYAHNDFDGIAYQCRFGEDGALYIDTLGTFTKVSGECRGKTSATQGRNSGCFPTCPAIPAAGRW